MDLPVSYVDRQGRHLPLYDLDDEERRLVVEVQQRAARNPNWAEFDNFWTRAVAALYDGRGLPRTESLKTVVYAIAQDLSNRIAIAAGLACEPDYRDELAELIRTHFKTRREFCAATGLSEDMLSHVLARRKHLAIDTLMGALDRIGYTLHIVPRDGEQAALRNGTATHPANQRA